MKTKTKEIMETTCKRVMETARELILESHPEIQNMNHLNPKAAEFLYESPADESSADKVKMEIEKVIKAKTDRINSFLNDNSMKIDVFEFKVIIGSNSIDECLNLLKEHYKQNAESIGKAWDEESEESYENKWRYYFGIRSELLK